MLVIGFLVSGIVVRIIGLGDTTEAVTALVPPTANVDQTSLPTSPAPVPPAPNVNAIPTPATAALQSSDGLVAYWPADGDARDSVGGNHGTLRNGATFAPGIVGRAFRLDGVNDQAKMPG